MLVGDRFEQLCCLGQRLHEGGGGERVLCKPLWDPWDLVRVVREVVVEQVHCSVEDVFGV